jgi:hypothetical protein
VTRREPVAPTPLLVELVAIKVSEKRSGAGTPPIAPLMNGIWPPLAEIIMGKSARREARGAQSIVMVALRFSGTMFAKPNLSSLTPEGSHYKQPVRVGPCVSWRLYGQADGTCSEVWMNVGTITAQVQPVIDCSMKSGAVWHN